MTTKTLAFAVLWTLALLCLLGGSPWAAWTMLADEDDED